jgi:hypothetical protein
MAAKNLGVKGEPALCDKLVFAIFLGDVLMEGRCPQCGTHYQFWVLESLGGRICPYCGVDLKIKDSGGGSFTRSSPFNAKEYKVEPLKANSPFILNKPSNTNSMQDEDIINLKIENPYLFGLKEAIRDFKQNI